MVTAELNHNPYLLVTKVKFNGEAPRINCQIEKYDKQPLKDWVKVVPTIFFNEMNGYDFDLLFTGTGPDYEEVKKSFKKAGVSDEEVRLIHKNVIEDAYTKSKEIDDLLSWMRNHPNRRFSYDAFWTENRELFEGLYPYIIINGTMVPEIRPDISAEVVQTAEEIAGTNLSSVPIIFYIDDNIRNHFRQDLDIILKRDDIRQEQLFFIIDPSMNANQIIRVISDLGVIKPQVIDRYDDIAVMTYMRNYPVTEYVRDAISVFRNIADSIEQTLDSENEKSLLLNSRIHEEIDELEKDLSLLKETDGFFVQQDNYTLSHNFTDNKKVVTDQIKKWKNRKTKITGDHEIEYAANEYVSVLSKAIVSFVDKTELLYMEAATEIQNEFSLIYSSAGIDKDFMPDNVELSSFGQYSCPEIAARLIETKQVAYENPRTDFLGFIKKPSDTRTEPVRVVTCHLDEWRQIVEDILLPFMNDIIVICSKKLSQYYYELANHYHEHLTGLIKDNNLAKESVSAQLSEDERNLQEDNDWLADIKAQLQNIERA